MRITNQMITGNSLRNMQKSMAEVNKRTEQLTSGKKISRASEDPVIAIRALKLRTTVEQLTQYKGKNIPDAESWFKITNTSLDNITSRIKGINDYCVQGSTDSFSTSDRSAIIDGLKQLKDMIYSEGNSTYAGRYIFSGYKTDRSLAFTNTEDVTKYSYDITQHIDPASLDTKTVVWSEVDYTKIDAYISGTETYKQPNPEMVYRMNLAYENIDDKNNADETVLDIKVLDADGAEMPLTGFAFNVKEPTDIKTYYEVGPDDINVIKETGEIIFGENVYNKLKMASDIQVSYAKKKFQADELRPEHYFDCTQYTVRSDGSIKETEYKTYEEGQPIYYEVNFNQSIQVNTEGNKIINADVGNDINDLIYALQDLMDAETAKTRLENMLKDVQYASDEASVAKINQLLSDVDVEIAVKRETMQKTFSANITNFQDYMSVVAAMESDVGSRMTKLDMIKTRVTEQYEAFKELKSVNEDTETDATIIDFEEANLVYESALAATGSIMNKTLLDYI
ncbi:MAG: flagellar hook-associated protein FlgL [Clostridium sp.]|nr:flagellar hook-associated protein FlgL [Clostridium sp.]MCM1398897.1 flagellar hook-associated protein FlgL [Clostridium sp.]MCM1458755.1 flagellar hook-associated protein FlgL [Bacteroides sp.]